MKIDFYWNGSFVGVEYSIMIDDDEIFLGEYGLSENEAKLKSINILKNNFNIDYELNDIWFKFGGKL